MPRRRRLFIGKPMTPAIHTEKNSYFAQLKKKVATSPTDPGVYKWLDCDGRILYVGKAKNLKKRLKSYVTGLHRDIDWNKRGLWEKMAALEVTVTSSELEAIILEMHLIRRHKPRYNVALKRDRSYIFVRVGVHEGFPSVRVVSVREKDDALYFGPFSSVGRQEAVLHALRLIYPFRTCSMRIQVNQQTSLLSRLSLPASRSSDISPSIQLDVTVSHKDRSAPCIDYHIEKCGGPCIGMIDPKLYKEQAIDGIIKFYNGDATEVLDKLKVLMIDASARQKFERAADIRDAISFIERITTRDILLPQMSREFADIIGLRVGENCCSAIVLQQRGGNVVNELSFVLDGTQETSAALAQFLVQYYEENDVPETIILPCIPDDASIIQKWLRARREKSVRFQYPRRGKRVALLKTADKNALLRLTALEAPVQQNKAQLQPQMIGQMID